MTASFTLPSDWQKSLSAELSKSYVTSLQDLLAREKAAGQEVYPPTNDIFNAFSQTKLQDVKVVILGQDPYHGPGQAHGLSFSVKKGVKLPPSLRNIYKEISREYGVPIPASGDLTPWARQGVLLLNATLTVRAGAAGSHQKKGWEDFTDVVIRLVSERLDHVVFMLWGSYAQKKSALIDVKKHLILEAPHPSPLSAHRGFIGCGHFKKANDYLVHHHRPAIDWTAI